MGPHEKKVWGSMDKVGYKRWNIKKKIKKFYKVKYSSCPTLGIFRILDFMFCKFQKNIKKLKNKINISDFQEETVPIQNPPRLDEKSMLVSYEKVSTRGHGLWGVTKDENDET